MQSTQQRTFGPCPQTMVVCSLFLRTTPSPVVVDNDHEQWRLWIWSRGWRKFCHCEGGCRKERKSARSPPSAVCVYVRVLISPQDCSRQTETIEPTDRNRNKNRIVKNERLIQLKLYSQYLQKLNRKRFQSISINIFHNIHPIPLCGTRTEQNRSFPSNWKKISKKNIGEQIEMVWAIHHA